MELLLKNIDKVSEFGALGIVTLALFAMLYWALKEHRKERSEWRNSIEEQAKANRETAKDGHEVIRQLTGVISGINQSNKR